MDAYAENLFQGVIVAAKCNGRREAYKTSLASMEIAIDVIRNRL